ncbi:Predicted arabinose efflux permease, MFS family [Frankineae bacterium MT45]|nr:Predicted arabinose efflux permease, MFS family [Frankineae bacterium MT45]
MTVTTSNPTFRDALRVREFRWLWIADTQSALGDQLTRVAIAVLVFSKTGSAALTALVFGMSYLPALIGGVFLSGLADRYPRRTVMVTCDVTRGVLVASIAFFTLPTAAVCVVVAVNSVLSSLFASAENASLPEILARETFPVANALRATTNQLSQLIGFALGGIVVAVLGARTGLAADAVTFGVSAALLRGGLKWRPATFVELDGEYLRSIANATRGLFADRYLRLLAYMIWMSACYTLQEGMASPYAHSVGAGSIGTGLLLAATPAGTAVGAYALSHLLNDRQRSFAMPRLAIAAGVPLMLCAFHPGLGVSVLLWSLTGLFGAYFVQAITLFTSRIGNQSRGQTIGLAAAALATAQGIAMPLGGVVADQLGVARAVAISGAIGAGLAVLLLRRWTKQSPSTSH